MEALFGKSQIMFILKYLFETMTMQLTPYNICRYRLYTRNEPISEG